MQFIFIKDEIIYDLENFSKIGKCHKKDGIYRKEGNSIYKRIPKNIFRGNLEFYFKFSNLEISNYKIDIPYKTTRDMHKEYVSRLKLILEVYGLEVEIIEQDFYHNLYINCGKIIFKFPITMIDDQYYFYANLT